jgi:hypothetical protein
MLTYLNIIDFVYKYFIFRARLEVLFHYWYPNECAHFSFMYRYAIVHVEKLQKSTTKSGLEGIIFQSSCLLLHKWQILFKEYMYIYKSKFHVETYNLLI